MHITKALKLNELYSETENKRVENAVDAYRRYFESDGGGIRIFSTPGRVEICGNQTDHNNGKVLAASVDYDIIAIVEPIEVGKAVVKYDDNPEIGIWYEDLSVKEEEKSTHTALVRGILKGLSAGGYKIGGFKAYITSNINSVGMAKTAAFEALLCTIISCLYNGGKIEPVRIAHISATAEKNYYGALTGSLMDKLACAVGGFIAIDFKDMGSPIVEKINIDFSLSEHSLCIVDTGMGNADLTLEFSSISTEMKKIAGFFDVSHLRQIAKQDIILNINALREEFGDRAVLRSLHFFDENNRVDKLAHALRTKEFEHFLDYINDSGNSSHKYLQNVFSCFEPEHESVSLGLYFCESALKGKGACRIHGEGFAGTIEAFVPNEMVKSFKINIERIFGAGSCHTPAIRPYGGVEIILP